MQDVKRKMEFVRSGTVEELKLFYVASPLNDKNSEIIEKNRKKALVYCHIVEQYMKNIGFKYVDVYAPHAYLPLFTDDNKPEDRKKALAIGISRLSCCDSFALCGDRISSGMANELLFALTRKMPIYHFTCADRKSSKIMLKNQIADYIENHKKYYKIFKKLGIDILSKKALENLLKNSGFKGARINVPINFEKIDTIDYRSVLDSETSQKRIRKNQQLIVSNELSILKNSMKEILVSLSNRSFYAEVLEGTIPYEKLSALIKEVNHRTKEIAKLNEDLESYTVGILTLMQEKQNELSTLNNKEIKSKLSN